ncbi:MAG: [Fe-Fe] hydrogenase large subunit C-terminal domain-containing protein [Clostridia bacterium]
MSQFLRLRKSNCKNCYKCIRYCPIKSIRFSGNQAHIVPEECILCGQCFVVCPQDAKLVDDEREKVGVLLYSQKPTYVSIAPSFIANYDGVGIEGMRKALKKLGFADVEETALGAHYVKSEYERILDEEKPEVLISSCCHSVNLLIQKYFPSCIKYLAKVNSPMLAHGQDLKKRYDDANVVFIGPCVSKKHEAQMFDGIDAVLTFEQLTAWLEEEGIELEKDLDANPNTRTRIFPTSGGVINSMDKNPNYTYLVVDGVENCISTLKDLENSQIENCFIEMSACYGSCSNGPVMEHHRQRSPLSNFMAVKKYSGDLDFTEAVPTKDELSKHMEVLCPDIIHPGEKEIQETLKQMGKDKPENVLNCGTCGYSTCRDKAIAICEGKADISMCLPFLKEKAENFSDNIINNTPNAIIVLNETLEIQQINKSALKMFKVKRIQDVMGDSVVRLLDPKVFLDVMSSKDDVHDRQTYLAEYERHVEQSVVYDKDYNLLICIMKDITSEEASRKRKDMISTSTIEIADKVVDKQMRIVQEIASLLGETAAETKIALTKLKESICDD